MHILFAILFIGALISLAAGGIVYQIAKDRHGEWL